jgi:modulator of FtsH protease
MNRNEVNILTRPSESVISTHKVLRNTYLLLSLTFLFSAFTAYIGYAIGARPSLLLMLVGSYGLMFLTQALRNSVWGIVGAFAFTGFMGYTLGPVLNYYLLSYANGGQLITTALGGTGIIFFALSGYVLTTKKDFTFLGGFLFIAMMLAFLGMLAAVFLQIPTLYLLVSAAFILIFSGMILFQTSEIINGGETNYIMATIGLYVSIYNIFVSLLNILGAFSGRDYRDFFCSLLLLVYPACLRSE